MRRNLIVFGALLVAVLIQTLAGQTRIDLSRQTRNIDLRSAPATQPAKSGAALPASCSQAEVFILTTASEGRNIYVCATPNHWVPQGALHVKSDGASLGTAPSQNFLSGFGIITEASNDDDEIAIKQSIDTRLVQTHASSQSGQALLCSSLSSSGTEYTCAMDPPLTRYTMGMLLRWIPDVTNTGFATLNVDALGARPIQTSDGSSDVPAGAILPGRLYEMWYDGSGFRLPAATKVSFEDNGVPVGKQTTVDYTKGDGITVSMADTGVKMAVQLDADTSYLLSKSASQSGSAILARDTGDDDDYAPSLTPTLTTYTPGMFILLQVLTASTGASTTNIDTLGPIANKESDGATDATIMAGVPYLMVYDGAVFRKVGSDRPLTPNQGLWMGSPDSNSGALSITGANKVYVQAVYVSAPWTIRRLLMDTSAADTLASSCLYSWGGPSSTTATLVASTSPAPLSAGFEDRAITGGVATITPGWYLTGFTGHQGTLGVKRGGASVYYTPVAGQELNSGVTDGSCPSILSGITTNWGTTWSWRIGWRY